MAASIAGFGIARFNISSHVQFLEFLPKIGSQ